MEVGLGTWERLGGPGLGQKLRSSLVCLWNEPREPGKLSERWLWISAVRSGHWTQGPQPAPAHRCGSRLFPGRWRRPQSQQAAGRGPVGGPPAEAAVAGPPGVHPQPRRGRSHLGQDRCVSAPLREASLAGAGGHPTQHEATGEAVREPQRARSGEGGADVPRKLMPAPAAAVDAALGGPAEEAEFRAVLPRDGEEQLQ